MKKISLLLAALLAVLVFCVSSCKPSEAQQQNQAASALGSVLAEEAATAAGSKKSIVIITVTRAKGIVSSAEEEFAKAIKKSGLNVLATLTPDLGDAMHYDDYGWSGKDFLEAVEKYPNAGAFVSFIGVPHLPAAQYSAIPATHSPVLVAAVGSLGEVSGIAAARNTLLGLLDAKIIQLAVIDGPDSSKAGNGKAGDTHALFSQNFQILRAGGPATP